jgi:SAM-dependent methyltransferase
VAELSPRERKVAAVVEAASDRRVASPELAAPAWEDFASLWELSQYRTTLFDALGFTGAGALRALELGCGLGSLTRWLGEAFGAVDAVEASEEHAAVARLRCADLPGVAVVGAVPAGASDTYDLVVVSGPADLPAAFAALADDGLALVLARNPVGLKYLNGALDDDTGKAYTSLYGAGGDTASLAALRAAAAAAGFAASDVLLPFPDHRLASTVLDPAGFAGDDVADAANWLFGTAPNRGAAAGTPRRPAFSETLAQRAVAEAGLLTELSNSFALLCWRGAPERAAARLGVDRTWAARHWSFDRRPACRKRVTRTKDGRIVNELAAGGTAGRGATIDLGVIEHRLADEPLRSGPLLAFRALRALAEDGPASRRLAELVLRYARWLVEAFGADGAVDAEGVPLLRGAALDAIWTNVVEDRATGDWVAVDGEWAFRGLLPLDYLVWRAVKDLPLRFGAEARGLDVVAVSGVAPDRVPLFMELEDAFHAAAGTGPTPTPSPRILPYVRVEETAPRFRILASAAEIVARPSLLKAYAVAFATAAATLVLVSGGDAGEPLAALQAALTAVGLDESTLPDTLLVDAGSIDGDAVLTASSWGPPTLPHFGPDDLSALRDLADERT